jgi:hypothetical protein
MSDPRSTRSRIFGALAAGLIVVGFCLLLLWHNPLVFWNDDYELSVLPVFADVARSWSHGHVPLLSPYSWVCGNLAGEFQYGTFSIFVNAAVFSIWKFPLTFSQQAAALSITHLFVLAAGAFLLAYDKLGGDVGAREAFTRRLSGPLLPRGEGGGAGNFPWRIVSLSIFVAVVATLNGWIICWGATDWFGALGAFTWLPWAWWGLERALGRASTSSRFFKRRHRQDVDATNHWRFLWPAPFVYLVVTGGFPYTVVMLALLIVWLSVRVLSETRRFMIIVPMLLGVALGIGLSAPAWLALFDYVHGSARGLEAAGAHWQWIVPWQALPGFILPCWTVSWADFWTRYLPHTATELASGLVAPAALIAGFLWKPRMLVKHLKWELILLGGLLLLCMVPTAGPFRWSFRWLPFLHLVLALCAAEVLRLRPRSPTGSMSVLLLIVISIAMGLSGTAGKYGVGLAWVYFEIAAVWALYELFLPRTRLRDWAPALVTFGMLLATYFIIPTNCGVPRFNFSQQLLRSKPLDPRRLYLSVYPAPEWSYRIENEPHPVGQVVRPGSTSMWAGVRLINGYSPITASGVARKFGFATHGEIDPTTAESLLSDQAGRDGLLARLGVDGILVAKGMDMRPAPGGEWRQVFSSNEGRVYDRVGPPFARLRSFSSIDTRPGDRFAVARVSRIEESRNCVAAEVSVPAGGSPALLTFSRPYFRGYVARLGDRRIRVESYRGLFPMVQLPAGSHGELVLNYRPWWLIYGGAVAVVSAAIWLFGIAAAVVLRRKRRPE